MTRWIARGAMLLTAWTAATAGLAELTVSLDENNALVLEADSLELLAVEFQSPAGSLLSSDIANPFQGVIFEGTAWALYYNLGTPYLLDGSITLQTKWDPSKRNDILFQYGTPTIEVGLQPIEGHELFAAQVGPEPIIAGQQPGEFLGDFALEGIESGFAAWAGRSGVDLFLAEPMTVTKLSIQSVSGELIPRGPFEFETIVQESPMKVQFSSLHGVELDGEYRLPIGWAGDSFDDLTLSLSTINGETLTAYWQDVKNLPEPTSMRTMWILVLVVCKWRRRSGRVRS